MNDIFTDIGVTVVGFFILVGIYAIVDTAYKSYKERQGKNNKD